MPKRIDIPCACGRTITLWTESQIETSGFHPVPATAPEPPVPAGIDWANSIDSLEIGVRALNGLCHGMEQLGETDWWKARERHWRSILELRPRQIKNFGEVSFSEICEALHHRGLSDEDLRQSKWWIAAPARWRLRWQRRRESITGA